MNIFSGLEKIVETNYPLAKDTWYGLGGPADYFIRPETVEQLKKVTKRCNENDIPIYVLGKQMNIFSGLDKIVETDYLLAKDTWYGLGGPADYFIPCVLGQ